MCSSPKGGSSKPRISSVVDSTFSDMTASEYSDLVQKANESYEKRQEELLEYRKNRVSSYPLVQTLAQKNISNISFLEKIKTFLTPHFLSTK